MHLLAVVDAPDHVCCRYRLAAFRSHWARAGHALSLHPWPRRWWSWPALVSRLRRADAVIVQRQLPNRWQARLLRQAARRLIFDFDDAIFGRDSYASKGISCSRRTRRFAAFCALTDAMIAGNAFLRDQAARFISADRIHVIPTCVDPILYPTARHERRGADVQLVWLGSSSTLRGLEAIRPLLEELGQGTPGLRLKLLCDRFFHLDHLPVVAVPWTEAGEATELASADIGISWMPDDDWSRGKCGLKVLQYMAAGLPVVANPVGVHRDMVRHGENGYLAETPAQWCAAVARLAGDPTLRRRMGAMGRQRLEADFSVSQGAQAWQIVFEQLKQGRTAA